MSGYFLYHSIGTFPGKARRMRDALAQFSDHWCAEDDGQWPYALALRQRFIDNWAQLVEVPSASLTTTENVTAALYSLIGALPAGYLKNRRVLVAADCFPSLHFLLSGIAPRFGFTLETVPLRPGQTWVQDEDMLERWQADVGLALLTFVTSTTSHRPNVARLCAHGRAMGTLVGVDITQGVGVSPFSVKECGADFVVSTSLKWLCGASGAGILHVRPDLIAECSPELRGWFSQENPFSWDLDTFSYAADIRRFDHGTPAIPACAASLPGLEWVMETGVAAIQAQNRTLTEQIVCHAHERGWQLASPALPEQRGGSVMLIIPDRLNSQEIIASLRSQQLYCDARGSILRLSPGMVTRAEDVERMLAALDQLFDQG